MQGLTCVVSSSNLAPYIFEKNDSFYDCLVCLQLRIQTDLCCFYSPNIARMTYTLLEVTADNQYKLNQWKQMLRLKRRPKIGYVIGNPLSAHGHLGVGKWKDIVKSNFYHLHQTPKIHCHLFFSECGYLSTEIKVFFTCFLHFCYFTEIDLMHCSLKF